MSNTRYWGLIAAGVAAFASGGVQAAGGAGSKFLGADFSYNGFIRFDAAFSTDDRVQQANQFGDLANGVPVIREPGNPLTGYATPLQPAIISAGGIGNLLGGALPQLSQTLIDSFNAIPSTLIGGPPLGVGNQVGVNDTVTRYVPKKNQLLNYHLLRFEITPTLSWGDWSLITRLRAVYDPDDLGYNDFDYRVYDNINGGIEGGLSRQYHTTPDKLGYQVEGNKNPIFFERSGRNYMVDLPAFFVQWNSGNTTVRIGNQTVAWGQLLFFRIMDTANGLDLRRHLVLNRVVEEYADSRASAPGIRITSQITDSISADFFAQQFIPTVINNVNTPYNVVASQFTLHDRYDQGGYNTNVNYGLRFKGEFGNYSLQAMFTHRYNPLGAIRWSRSGVNKALPNSNLLGAVFNQYCNLVLGTGGQGCGPVLAETPFEVAPAGLFSAEEWFNYAGYQKLDALDGLNRVVSDFEAAQSLLARDIGQNSEAAAYQLNAFFQAGEGLAATSNAITSPKTCSASAAAS